LRPWSTHLKMRIVKIRGVIVMLLRIVCVTYLLVR
jgi:hypothetical protein